MTFEIVPRALGLGWNSADEAVLYAKLRLWSTSTHAQRLLVAVSEQLRKQGGQTCPPPGKECQQF
jgi:hypothetical protein